MTTTTLPNLRVLEGSRSLPGTSCERGTQLMDDLTYAPQRCRCCDCHLLVSSRERFVRRLDKYPLCHRCREECEIETTADRLLERSCPKGRAGDIERP